MNKNILIAVLVVAVLAAAYFLYQENRKEKVSINIGGKEISATFDKE